MKNLNKKTKYKFMWGQKQSAMFAEYMLLNFAVRNKEFTITAGINDVIREHNKGFSYIYFSETAIENGYKNSKRFLDTKESESIFTRIDNMVKDSRQFYTELRQLNYNVLTKEEIIGNIKKHAEKFLFGQKLFRASDPSSTKMVEDEIKNILKDKYEDDQLIEKFITLVTPTELDKTQQELVDLYNLASNNKLPTKDELLNCVFTYPANYANTWSYGEILQYLKEKISKVNITKLKQEIEQIKKTKTTTKEKQEIIYQEFIRDAKLKQHATILQNLALKRFELKHAWAGGEILCLEFLQYLAKQINLDFKIFMESYNFTDLLNFYENGTKLTANEIETRREYSVIHYIKNSLHYLYGKKAKDYFKKRYSLETINELKGMVANKGTADGLVRIVKVDDLSQFIKDSNDFNKGEILVTTMTSPIMLTLASKAAAIVTNEGGVCSHAAVIARELNIPCIVGTHDATNAFRTGERVYVDALKGVIRKIQ